MRVGETGDVRKKIPYRWRCHYCHEEFETDAIWHPHGVSHGCEATKAQERAWLQRQWREVREGLDHPDEKQVADVLQSTRLPRRSPLGLQRLQQRAGNAAALQAARQILDDWFWSKRRKVPPPDQGLFLHGPVGSGKTAILQALGFDLRHRSGEHQHSDPTEYEPFSWLPKLRVEFWPVADLFAHIKRTFDRGKSDYDPDRLERCDLLILDDLGKTLTTQWNQGELFRLIDARYRERRMTCFTSNYPPRTLAARMAKRLEPEFAPDVAALFDRIRETTQVFKVDGPSWRTPKATVGEQGE